MAQGFDNGVLMRLELTYACSLNDFQLSMGFIEVILFFLDYIYLYKYI